MFVTIGADVLFSLAGDINLDALHRSHGDPGR